MNSYEEISKKIDYEDLVKVEKKSAFLNEVVFFTACPIFFLISGIHYYAAYFRELGISEMVDWNWETTTLRGGILSIYVMTIVLTVLFLIRVIRKHTSIERVIFKKFNNRWVLILSPIIFCVPLLLGMQFVWNQHGDKGTADAKDKLAKPTKVIYSLKGSSSDRKEAEFLYRSPSNIVCLRSSDRAKKLVTCYYSFSDFSYFEIIDQIDSETR